MPDQKGIDGFVNVMAVQWCPSPVMGTNDSIEIAERVAMVEVWSEDKTVLAPGCRTPIEEWMRMEA